LPGSLTNVRWMRRKILSSMWSDRRVVVVDDKSFSFPESSVVIDATSIVGEESTFCQSIYRQTFLSFSHSHFFFCFKSFGIGVKESEIDVQITKGARSLLLVDTQQIGQQKKIKAKVQVSNNVKNLERLELQFRRLVQKKTFRSLMCSFIRSMIRMREWTPSRLDRKTVCKILSHIWRDCNLIFQLDRCCELGL